MTISANHWIRRPGRTRFGATLAVAMSVAALLAPWLWPVHGTQRAGGPAGLGAAALLGCMALAAAGAWLARRLARTGLWVGADRVIVRNPIRTWTIELGNVRSFALAAPPGPRAHGDPVPVLCRREGPPVEVWALGRHHDARRPAAGELEPLCDGLNDLLLALRAPNSR